MHLFSKGFTLAELLAVVIIIAVMSSFGVGYYRRSVAQAKFNDLLVQSGRAAEDCNVQYFEYQLEGNGTANLSCGVCKTGSHYYVEVSPDYKPSLAPSNYEPGRVACVGKDEKGQAFCESMGYLDCDASKYTSCSSSGIVCVKDSNN